MSFAFFPLYTGDYLRDTRHLTPLKHGIYLLALMHCWDQKGPMPLEEQECAGICNCRSHDEIDALRYVLARFFVKLEDGHYNKRIQAEIERSAAISEARSGAAKTRWKARESIKKLDVAAHDASALQVQSKSNGLGPSPPPPPQLQPIPETNTASRKRSAAAAPLVCVSDLIAEGVDSQVATDWLAVRRQKKAPLTRTAWARIKAKAADARMSVADAVRASAENGWAGFDGAWLTSRAGSSATVESDAAEKTRAHLEAEDRRWAEIRAKKAAAGGRQKHE